MYTEDTLLHMRYLCHKQEIVRVIEFKMGRVLKIFLGYFLFILFKGNDYTFKGSSPVIFIFASLVSGSLLLKERICSIGANWIKFIPLIVDLIMEGFP